MTRRIAVTGMGVVSPTGMGIGRFLDALFAARSGIRRITAPFGGQLQVRVAGEVDMDAASQFPKTKLALLDRCSQFALLAAREAMADSGLALDEQERGRTGIFVGTSMGGAQTLESGYSDLYRDGRDRLPPYTVLRSMHNAPAAHLSMEFGLSGASNTYATACSSSAVAIGEAMRAIRHGYADFALAGGTESMITYGTLRAWEALHALAHEDAADPSASCRPFSRDRDGLVLGEGAGILVLEDLEHARARGAHIHAEIAGYGAASDASHVSKPHSSGQVKAMREALADAGMNADAIDYINAHGTATLAGDAVETAAIREAFGTHAGRLAASSTKSMHGHLMGAAGAVEFIASVLAIGHRFLPPTANLRIPDPECDLDFVANVARHDVRVRAAMSNSFGFGGGNAVLIAKQPAT